MYEAKLSQVQKPEYQGQIGTIVIWGMRYDAANKEWNGGQIRLPGMDHAAQGYIRLDSEQQLTITGYHGLRWLGKSRTLTRLAQ